MKTVLWLAAVIGLGYAVRASWDHTPLRWWLLAATAAVFSVPFVLAFGRGLAMGLRGERTAGKDGTVADDAETGS